MYSEKAKIMVAEQIINMLDNNVLQNNGYESFKGWLEDGDVFYNDDRYTDAEAAEAMKLVDNVADLVDDLAWRLSPENDW